MDHTSYDHLHSGTQTAISREKAKRHHQQPRLVQQWKHAAELARRWSRSRTHYREQFNVCTTEHMSIVDPFNGSSAPKGEDTRIRPEVNEDEDLLLVSPGIDGRLRDEGRV